MTSYYNFRFLRRHHSASNVLKFEYWMKFSIVGSYKYILSTWNNFIVIYFTQYLEHIYSPVKKICKKMKSWTHTAFPTLNKTRNLPPCHLTSLTLFSPCHLTTLLLFQNLPPHYTPTFLTFPDDYSPTFPSSPSSLWQINPSKITTKTFFLCPHWYKVHNIRILRQAHISPPRKWSRTTGLEVRYANH